MLKLCVVVLFVMVSGVGVSFHGAASSQVAGSDVLKNNTCVSCHSRVSAASDLSNRYLEWRLSRHSANSVGCEKCHGGDPTKDDSKQAHAGVFPPSNSRSRLNDSKVVETCAACHQAIAKSFAESAHYQRLRTSGMGPSCTSCHAHMASSVRRSGAQGESLCTYCHNAANGLLPQRPDIPEGAKATLDAIQRTQYVLTLISDLLPAAEKRNIAVDGERKDADAVKASLEGAKVAWHTFNLSGVLEMANKTFAQAVDIRDRLNKKLGRN
jgi:predicted CXXCH cytochrome family protein